MALNDAAKKVVARAARIDVEQYADRLKLGANQDDLAGDAWSIATASNPEIKDWSGAYAYFERVFFSELSRYE